jgi:hypothetical protein
MTFERVPPTLTHYAVDARTLALTREFLQERGEHGLEGVVLWLGRPLDEHHAEILAPYAPEQVGFKSEEGVAVQVTDEGLSGLISALPPGMFVLCRVHSHPSEAYHSELDDTNMIISHPGAISIVVPFYARSPIVLPDCSINELQYGSGWRELSRAEILERFEVRA